MRNAVLFVLAVIVCALWFSLHSQSIEIKSLQRNLSDAEKKAVSATKLAASASLDMQGECARQAQEKYNSDGWSTKKFAGFTDHYNAILTKCFVEIGDTEVTDGIPMTTMNVLDAFEGKLYGSYIWINPKGKKFWQVTPSICNVILPSGEERKCRSSGEFDELVKPYMGDAELN